MSSSGACPGSRSRRSRSGTSSSRGGERELEETRAHERVHVRQYEKWGPLFPLLYVASSVAALVRGREAHGGNVFERQAFRESGEVSRRERGGCVRAGRGRASPGRWRNALRPFVRSPARTGRMLGTRRSGLRRRSPSISPCRMTRSSPSWRAGRACGSSCPGGSVASCAGSSSRRSSRERFPGASPRRGKSARRRPLRRPRREPGG